MDANRLAISVEDPTTGRSVRWGPDEPLAVNIPDDLTFSTSVPGGHKNMTCSLLREITSDYPDLGLFSTVTVYGPGNVIAWQGRLTQVPRSHGDGFSITPGCVGWSAHLLDDPSFREIYVDQDLTRWREPSAARSLQLLGLTPALVTAQWSVSADADPSGRPAIHHSSARLVGDATQRGRAESWYDAGGIPVDAISYEVSAVNLGNGADASWTVQAALITDDAVTSFNLGTDHNGANGPIAANLHATATRKFALLNTQYDANLAAADGHWDVYWAKIGVYGTHGLTGHGASAPFGFFASDVVADIVERTAPLLTYTTGSSGSIQPTTFVIPHLVFDQPTTGSDAISFVNAYHQYDWGVYDNKQFFFRPADPDTLTWEARLSEGARVDLEGDVADQAYNGVFVTYTDATGVQKTVGPPGATADATDPVLADTSADNPVNAAGLPRRWAPLTISQPTNLAGATQIGFVWLAEHSLPQRRGTLTLTGTATHPTEGKVPVWRVRAGDFIRISDHPADVPRRIIETSYSHANGGVLTATLDNTVFKLESIIERALGVQMVGVL